MQDLGTATSFIKSVACGKAILLGEHFVVYNAPAVALSIPRAVEVEISAHDAFCLAIPQWDLVLHPSKDGHLLAQALHALLQQLPDVPPALLTARLHLPSGVGLGSSASLGLAILDGLVNHAGLRLTEDERYEQLFAWERVFHGNPSGFDHAAAMRQGLTWFQRHASPCMQSLPIPWDLRFIVAQIEDGASTKTMVDGVRDWRQDHPDAFETLLRRAQDRVANLMAMITQDHSQTVNRHALGALLSDNQQDLQRIGVSTPALNQACITAQSAGAFGAKLIGAGGGGCILALVDTDNERDIFNALKPQAQHLLSIHLPADPIP